jgi:ribosomal protein S28E/S33
MSDDAFPPDPDRLRDIWRAVESDGFAVTSDQSIGLPEKFRQNFRGAYFNDWTLRHDAGDMPADRLRARDVIRYQWRDGSPVLSRHDAITITDRAGIAGRREHARVELMQDPQGRDLARALLGLVPPARRQDEGTLGVNLFRTFTNVVTAPHHDNEEFIIIYVLDRLGEGAETYLYAPQDVTADGQTTAPPLLRQQLNPGDIIVFEDARFKHGATPLVNPDGGATRRDAIISTVDYRGTYLETTPG